jgi:mannobiose 2-epimerase
VYSAAYRFTKNVANLDAASYAYRYLSDFYLDKKHGGVFWSVNVNGKPVNRKKQTYGEAFAIYGLSEYARALFEAGGQSSVDISSHTVLQQAFGIFMYLETRVFDPVYGGYFEARAEDWSETADTALSSSDINCEKSMNTNLHVMEALSNLLRAHALIKPNDKRQSYELFDSLFALIRVTIQKIAGDDGHLNLFFKKDWKVMNDIVSFGHDIEASWLIWEAVTVPEDAGIGEIYAEVPEFAKNREAIRAHVIKMARVQLDEGFDAVTGALENEIHEKNKRDRTRIWWCQAESMVGFFNAWQLTGEEKYIKAVHLQWKWIKTHQRDTVNGDWFWGVAPDGRPILQYPKGGNWKTPYHNARACMEIIRRMEQ